MQFLGEHGLLHGLIKNMVMESYEKREMAIKYLT